MFVMYHENETKDKILKAGLKMLNQSGYGSLNISELARQAKISKQNLYYHYSSMEDVLIALAELWSSTGQQCTLQALANSPEMGAHRILAISKGMFDWMRAHQDLSRLGLVLFQSGSLIRKLDQFMEKARVAARQRIAELLKQEPYFSKMKNSKLEEVITSAHSMMYGFFLYVIVMNDFSNLEMHEKNCQESLRRLLQTYR